MKTKLSTLGACLLLLLASPARGDELTRQVQEELRKRNLYFGDIDGRPTPGLSAALASYQQRKGFPCSGAPTEETLSSLSLLPPPSGPPPLPDLPVLKSDAGRQLPAAPPPAAPSAPPPVTATKWTISADEARLFIERYLLAGQANDPAAEAAFYAERVDYFEEGMVDRRFIERDIRRYNARWPERSFKLDGAVRVISGDDPAAIVLEVEYRFLVKGRKYRVHGKVTSTYTLAGSRPEELRIVRVKERRLRR